jgi:SAM-dependent methyltransferase
MPEGFADRSTAAFGGSARGGSQIIHNDSFDSCFSIVLYLLHCKYGWLVFANGENPPYANRYISPAARGKDKDMTILTDSSSAGMHFTISWKSANACHEEHYFAADVNMWRDIFPDALRQKLLGSRPGDTISHSFTANELFPGRTRDIVPLPLRHWQPPLSNGSSTLPQPGRYYPQGFVHGVPGIYPQTLAPLRVVAVNNKTITVDLNHPLIGKNLDVTVKLEAVSPNRKERGGRCSDRLIDMLDNGPGMQARRAGSPIVFDPKKAFLRSDPGKDRLFYAAPRMVSHIDRLAGTHLASVIGRFLKPGEQVLDLMASIDSHLPDNHSADITGLGMNREEMAANRDLARHIVHDLNNDPVLPFEDRSFDVVLCSLSIEYLTDPEHVIRETARVLKPQGTLLVSFSNRWFPPKVTRMWTELHEFERMGFVLQLCWPHYTDLRTFSYRNWPRPSSDRYFSMMRTSDPLYVVTGSVRS